MPDESSMNHQPFESMPSARPQSFPGAASSMTVPTRGNPSRGKPSGAFIASCPVSAVPGLHVDLYYLGILRQNAPFNSGVAHERRQTMGTRVWGGAAAWDYDTEGIFQFGDFGSGNIRAWSVASNTGYTLASLWGEPRLGLQADVASGGGPGRTLKSFYPLFPKFAYFTEASINAPINFIDVFPSVTVQPLRNFAFKVGVDVLWRYSVQDAFYQPPGVPLVPGSANKKRFLGLHSPTSKQNGRRPHISLSTRPTSTS